MATTRQQHKDADEEKQSDAGRRLQTRTPHITREKKEAWTTRPYKIGKETKARCDSLLCCSQQRAAVATLRNGGCDENLRLTRNEGKTTAKKNNFPLWFCFKPCFLWQNVLFTRFFTAQCFTKIPPKKTSLVAALLHAELQSGGGMLGRPHRTPRFGCPESTPASTPRTWTRGRLAAATPQLLDQLVGCSRRQLVLPWSLNQPLLPFPKPGWGTKVLDLKYGLCDLVKAVTKTVFLKFSRPTPIKHQ